MKQVSTKKLGKAWFRAIVCEIIQKSGAGNVTDFKLSYGIRSRRRRVVVGVHGDLLFQNRIIGKDKLPVPFPGAYKIDENIHFTAAKILFHIRHIIIAHHLSPEAGIHADGLWQVDIVSPQISISAQKNC